MRTITLTILEFTIFFHCLSVFNGGLRKKTLTVYQNYGAGMLVGFCVQRLLKIYRELLSNSPFANNFEAIVSYMLIASGICQFQVLAARCEDLSLLS